MELADKEEELKVQESEQELKPQKKHKSSKQEDNVKVYMAYAIRGKYHKGLNLISKKELKELQKTNISFEIR